MLVNKDYYITQHSSSNMPLCTSNDRKDITHRFLFSLAVLSNCKNNFLGNGCDFFVKLLKVIEMIKNDLRKYELLKYSMIK